MVRLHKFNGIQMYLNDEYITHQFIFDNGLNYEPHVRQQIERYVPTASVMWDIGSNAGVHTASAKQVNPLLTVVCFEPSTSNRECLMQTIYWNGWKDVFVVPTAISDHNGIIGINTCPDDPVCGSVDSDHTLLVPAFTLDSFNLPLPDFVKIDIEGFELKALRAASAMMEKHPVIVSEFNMQLLAMHHDPREYLEFILGQGYVLYLLQPTAPPIKVYDTKIAAEQVTKDMNNICDLLAVPKS